MSPSLVHTAVCILFLGRVKFPWFQWKLKRGFLKVQKPSGTLLPLKVKQIRKHGHFLNQHLRE